jgi:hypothetical protein
MSVTQQITVTITSPASAVPAVTVVGVGNWLGVLPEIINILTAVYLLLLISHKAYVFMKEWKTKKIIKDE